MRWISVKDKLPEKGVENSYLITDGKTISTGYLDYSSDIQEVYSDDDPLYWHDDGDLLSTCYSGFPEVTHWSKLPKLPNS